MYTCLKFGVVLPCRRYYLRWRLGRLLLGKILGLGSKGNLEPHCSLCLHDYPSCRYTNWITERRFIPLTAFAFLSVMMAWFGVNYILAAGLHSYGFSEGGAIFLGLFFSIQIGIILATTPRLLKAQGR